MSGGNTSETLPPVSESGSGARPPLLLPYSSSSKNSSVEFGRLHGPERLILVRDPPRERLARARSSAEPEETLLARVGGKQYPYRHTTTTRTTNLGVPFPHTASSNPNPETEEEFYADLYQYYYDVTKTTSNDIPATTSGRVKPKSKPKSKSESYSKSNATARKGGHESEDTEREGGSDTERDEERKSQLVMSKKRGSLQAIFVPSFLQTSTPTELANSPPSSPTTTTTKYVQRLRALSAVAQPPSPSHHATFNDASSGENAGTSTGGVEGGGALGGFHQRKRSMTFNIMTSFSSNSNVAASTAPSPTTPTAATHSNVHSPRSSPPPAFLLDDDPFANLTSAPSESMAIRSQQHQPPSMIDASSPLIQSQVPLPVHPIPRSPLHETVPLVLPSVASVVAGTVGGPSSASTFSSALPPSSTQGLISTPLPSSSSPSTVSPNVINIAPIMIPSTSTSNLMLGVNQKAKSAPSSPPASASPSNAVFLGTAHPSISSSSHPYPAPPPSPRVLPSRAQPRPAHQRPAFTPRPSLPSLDTLARMNVVLTKKVRKGRVGAGLPFEPWDLPSDDESLPTPPLPLSASSSSSSSSRSLGHNQAANSNSSSNAESNVNAEQNDNVNSYANHDVHPDASSPISSPTTGMPITSTSMPTSPIPIPSSASASSSYVDFDSDSSSGSTSTTPTSSLIASHSYQRRPSSPSHAHIVRPQPLLPSQIMALGSVAADVEMVIPVGNSRRVGGTGSDFAWSRPEIQSDSTSQQRHHHQETPSLGMASSVSNWIPTLPSVPPPPPATTLPIQSLLTGPLDPVPELDSSFSSLDGDVLADEEGQGQASHEEDEEYDEYFGDLLDRYQIPSRATSEDGHGHEQTDVEAMPTSKVEIEVETCNIVESEVEGVSETLEIVQEKEEMGHETGATLESPKPKADVIVESEYAHSSAHGSAEGDVDVEAEQHSGLRRSDSFLSSPSSASLARSFSARSDSSVGSADSGHAAEHAGRRDMAGRMNMWSYRRFADPSQSLSSLELDLERGGDDEGPEMMFDVDADPTSIVRERGDSTRSSSSHPSLSRTRSSSDDSDALQSPTPGDYDYSFFPYSHARSFARFYQSGYSTLFTPPVASEEDGPSFQPEPDRLNLSSSSLSVDDLGEREANEWGKTFSEEGMGMTMPGGLAADVNGEGGFGFGFDKEKTLIAAEECQRDDVEEKESLANTTSIAAARPTSTVTREADRHSFSSSEYSLPVFASSSSSSVSHESNLLDPESVNQTIHHPGASIDDMFTRIPLTSNYSQARTRTTTMHPRSHSTAAEPIDSSGHRRRGYSSPSSNSQSYSAETSHGQTTNYNPTSSLYHPRGSKGINGRWGKGNSDEEDGEEDERRRRRALERIYADDGARMNASSTSSSEEDEADNYGEGGKSMSKTRLASWSTTTTGSRSAPMTNPFASASSRSPMDFPASSNHSSRYASEDERESDDDDDDVPLAQRIPGALTAQKTMRRQFREEREQRKREKAERLQSGDAERRARQETLRPAGAGTVLQDSVGVVTGSSSHDAAMLATSAVHGQRRPRTLTLPGKSPMSPSSAFNPHDLARKLQNVQMAEVSPPTYPQQYPPQYQNFQQHQDVQTALSPSHLRAKSLSRTSAERQQQYSPSYPAVPPLPITSPVNHPRSSKDPSSPYRQVSPISPAPGHGPPNATLRPMRSFHRPSERRPSGIDDQHAPLPTDTARRLERASTSATRNPHRRSPSQSRASADRPERATDPVPPLPAMLNARSSNEESKKLVKVNTVSEPRTSTRTSGDVDHPARVGIAQQPMPGLVNVHKVVVSQQRIFVGNLQQFHMVEIGPSTTAGDVVAMLDAEGALNGWAGSGGWMVFEIAQDFGMERPVRSYELLADVQASWLKDKTVNFFVLKLTPLAIPLSRNAIPSSSPTHSAYVEWEAKRGKWSKRWLQLREHNLYLSKRDNGKDEVLMCSLSNFDAYQITRAHRAPKPYAFAIKSTDNLSFFENTADYLHTFSCSEKDGKIWMEKILVARSYVLHQERQVLFSPKSTSNNPSAPVSRSGTKKYAAVRPTHQPLVALPPLGMAQPTPHHDVFEPGSLLAKHI